MSLRLRQPSIYFSLSLAMASLSACGLDAVPSQGASTGTPNADLSSADEPSTQQDSSDGTKDTSSSSDDASSSTSAPSSSEGSSSSTQDPTTEETNESSSGSSSSDASSSDTSSSDSSSSSTDTGTQDPGKIDCDALKFSGFEPGQVPNAVSLTDSEGNPVQLRDACNETVVIMSGDST